MGQPGLDDLCGLADGIPSSSLRRLGRRQLKLTGITFSSQALRQSGDWVGSLSLANWGPELGGAKPQVAVTVVVDTQGLFLEVPEEFGASFGHHGSGGDGAIYGACQ